MSLEVEYQNMICENATNVTIEKNNTYEDHLIDTNSPSEMGILFFGPIFEFACDLAFLGILNTYLKKLHRTMKIILNILAIHNLVACIATTSTLIYMILSKNQSFEVCSLLNLFHFPAGCITIATMTLLSYVRFHIAWKTENSENIHHNRVIRLTVLIYISEYFYTIPIYLSLANDIVSWPQFAVACSGGKLDGPPFFPIFQMTRVIAFMIVGIFYDLYLVQLLQKRKQNKGLGPKGSQLVPWKSAKNQENINIKIPVSATIGASVNIIIAVIITIFGCVMYQADLGSNWKFMLSGCFLLYGFQLFVLVGLTFRAAKKVKPAPVLPMKPMFHDGKNDDTDVEEEANEEFDSVFSVSINVPEDNFAFDQDNNARDSDTPLDDERIEVIDNEYPNVGDFHHARIIFVKPASYVNKYSNVEYPMD